jgi:hypothetical protein
MNQLEERLRAYARALDEATPSPPPDAVVTADGPRHGWHRTLPRVVAGLLIAAVVVSAIAWIVMSRAPRDGKLSVGDKPSRLAQCALAHFSPLSNSADALPNVAYTTNGYVADVLRLSGDDIVRKYHAKSIEMTRLVGHAWLRAPYGNNVLVVVTRPIYVLDVRLTQRAACPAAPSAYNGVQLRFWAPTA